MQRFVRPAIFVLIFAAVLFLAIFTGRGESLTSPFLMGRLADFADGSPLLSTLFAIVLLPLALALCLFPEDTAITMAVGGFGFWFGILVATYALTAVGGTVCTLTRGLLQGTVRRFIAARRQAGKGFSRRAVLPLEYCLLVEVVLLVCNAPVILAGLLLGLAGMRTKSFCVAAVPILLARTSMIALGTAEAGLFTLLVLCLFGTILFVLYLFWLRTLFHKRVEKEREDSIKALVKPSEAFREPRPAFENIDMDDDAEHVETRPQRDNLSLGKTLVVLVRERANDAGAAEEAGTDVAGAANAALPGEDLVARLAQEGRSQGLRVLVCSMDASLARDADGRERTILGGFSETDVVADLGELFWRGFQEGAGTVLAVRAASPFVSGSVLACAVEAAKRSGLSLVPLMGEKKPSFCVVGIQSPFGQRRFERGLLRALRFRADLAFALTGFAPHPEVLPPLPHESLCRPLVSVVLVAETASRVLLESIRRVRSRSCAECAALLLPKARELEDEARALGAVVVHADDIRGANDAVKELKGSVVLFTVAGVLLPERFDEFVWQCMERERCVLGSFGLPALVPGLQRALRWFGSSVRPGKGSGPSLVQGIFLGREDFVRFGGFESANIEEAVDALVQRAHLEGDVVPHNRRVTLARGGSGTDERDEKDGAAKAGGLAKFGLARLFERRKDAEELASSGQEEMEKARAMVEECDHCGRCTHVSPMLHKHKVDLADLPKKPLLAWHCFLCGACTAVCHKGIDAVNLARTLRKAHVARHGNRVARPGHGKTVALQKMVGVFTKTALPGRNLLLDADFCCAWPQTALALASKMRSWNVGVVIAEPGARAMDLGLEAGARKKVHALRSVMDKKGITGFYTVTPTTHAFLVAMGIACDPVYTLLREMGQAHVDLTGRHLLDPANDRAREAFAASLAPLLDGERRAIDLPCCGAGGEAAVMEPQISADLKNAVKTALKPKERVLTTSTHCAESLSHAGIACDHALTALMGLKERAASGPGQISALVKTLVAVSSLASDRSGKGEGEEGSESRAAGVRGLFRKFMKPDGEGRSDAPAAPLDIRMPGEDDLADEPADKPGTELEVGLGDSGPKAGDMAPAEAGGKGAGAEGVSEEEVSAGTLQAPEEEAVAASGTPDEGEEGGKAGEGALPEQPREHPEAELEEQDASNIPDNRDTFKEKLEENVDVKPEEDSAKTPAQSEDMSAGMQDGETAKTGGGTSKGTPETSARPVTRKPKIVFSPVNRTTRKKDTAADVAEKSTAVKGTAQESPAAKPAPKPGPAASNAAEKGVGEIPEAEVAQAGETQAEEAQIGGTQAAAAGKAEVDRTGNGGLDAEKADESADMPRKPAIRMDRAVSLKAFAAAAGPDGADDAQDKG